MARPGWAAAALLGALAALLLGCGRPPASSGSGEAHLRVVSLVPSATEILFALGAGEDVVGRSAYCDWPPEVSRVPVFGGAFAPDVEGVAACAPDLVLVGSRAQADALAGLPGSVRVERVSPDRISGLRTTIRRLASLVGRVQTGEELVARIDGALARARASARGARKEPPRVLFVVQREPLIVAGGGSYVGELLEALGARNVAGEQTRPWPTLSLESLVARDPTVILDASISPRREDEDVSAYWSRFPTLSAVREGRLERAGAPCLVRPGPRLPEALLELSRLTWGQR